MQTCARYSILVLGIIISLHFILRVTNEHYGRATSLSNFQDKYIKGSPPSSDTKPPANPISPESPINDGFYGSTNETLVVDRHANATFVILARNSDTNGVLRSVRDIEDRFNRQYGYPYVFLNDEPFTDEFKRRVANLSPSKMEFGTIPKEHWVQPDWIDEDKAKKSRDQMVKDNIIYGGSVSYRNMCRFNSGFFFKHELLQKYRWYWRIEPEVHFHCDIHYDPFLYMEDHNKTYSFTITMYEYEKTIPTLWATVKDFMEGNPQYIAEDNALGFMMNEGSDRYNLCHFWSNFEIADMDFWRGEAYQAFFEYLDEKGGFYYERWGDAPVHSIAAALFNSKDQIHFFDDIGYEHNPYTHCPQSQKTWDDARCSCDRGKSFDYDGYSCMKHWDKFMGKTT